LSSELAANHPNWDLYQNLKSPSADVDILSKSVYDRENNGRAIRLMQIIILFDSGGNEGTLS